MTPRWTIRHARVDDDVAIEQFLVTVPEFSGTLQPNEQRHVWRWLYARQNEQVENVLIATDANDAIIAHYGLSKLPYIIDGEKVDAGMACLLAIDEGYRKAAVFLELTMKLLKTFRSGELAFATGLANRAGLLEFHKAFGFKDIGEVPIYAKPIRLGKIIRASAPRASHKVLSPLIGAAQWAWLSALRLTRRNSSRDIHVERISAFDEMTAATSNEIAKHHQFYAQRGDAAVLNARFFGLDCRRYDVFRIMNDGRPVGYFALRVMDMKGFLAVGIVDICFDFARRDIAAAAFKAIDRFALDTGADLISILTNSAPLLARLRRSFFLKAPESFRLVILEPSKKRGLSTTKIDDWFVTWFEHDYV